MPQKLIQGGCFESCHLEEMFQQPNLVGLVAMDRNREPDDAPGFTINVMTAVDAEKLPATSLKDSSQVLAGNRLQTTISSTLSLSVRLGSST
ncbi:MAG: hypothetical protein ACRD3I_11920, partial [Terriglobales bacterium]